MGTTSATFAGLSPCLRLLASRCGRGRRQQYTAASPLVLQSQHPKYFWLVLLRTQIDLPFLSEACCLDFCSVCLPRSAGAELLRRLNGRAAMGAKRTCNKIASQISKKGLLLSGNLSCSVLSPLNRTQCADLPPLPCRDRSVGRRGIPV